MNKFDGRLFLNQCQTIIVLTVLLVLSIVLFSCNKRIESKSTVLITGKIENPKEAIIKLAGRYLDSTIISPIEDGEFSALIDISKPAYAYFTHGGEHAKLWLVPNQDFNMTLNTDEFNETLNFTGHGAAPNNYINSRILWEEKYPWEDEFWLDNENEFVTHMNERRSKQMRLLESFGSGNGLPSQLFEIEKGLIDIKWAIMLFSYQDVHRDMVIDPKFSVGEGYYGFREEIDINNDVYMLPRIRSKFARFVIELTTWHSRELGYSDLDFIEAVKFLESKITNQERLDFLLYLIINSELNEDGVDDKQLEDIKLFSEKCKNSEYITTVRDKFDEIKRDRFDEINILRTGVSAPTFNYENINGNTVALEDLKGSIVYLDVWATWCLPCLRELPHLEYLQDKFKNENVTFLSVSIDYDKTAWEKMVTERAMKGIQLIGDKAHESSIYKDYLIKGIPRFILIDHNGNIVESRAPRPSSDEIEPLLTSLLDNAGDKI